MKYFLYVCSLFIFLSSCTYNYPHRVSYEIAGLFNKGTDYKIVSNLIDLPKELELSFNIENNKNFKVLVFRRWISQNDPKSLFETNIEKYDLFMFAFENDKLTYWGDLDDFKLNDNKNLNKLGLLVSEELMINKSRKNDK